MAGMRRVVALLVVGLVGCKAKAAHNAREELREARASEAERELHAIGKAVRIYAAENDKLPAGHAPLTPAVPCCQHPSGLCEPAEEDRVWDAEPWDTLDFLLEDSHRFQYAYDSDGATFTARAVGDLDCKGDRVTITMVGRLGEDGEVVIERDDPLKADKKPKPVQ